MQTPCCGPWFHLLHGLMQECLPCTHAEGGPPEPKPVNAEAIGVSGKRYEDEFEFEKQRIKVRWIQGGRLLCVGRLLPLSDAWVLRLGLTFTHSRPFLGRPVSGAHPWPLLQGSMTEWG